LDPGKRPQTDLGFFKELEAWPQERIRELMMRATPQDVTRALERDRCSPEDLAALLSPQAASRLEEMARLAQGLTRRHFPLVPKLHLGTKMVAKLSLADKCVPKPSLGTRKKRESSHLSF